MALHHGNNGVKIGLRSQARQRTEGAINHVNPGVDGREVGSGLNPGGVVGVQVNRN